MPQRPPAPQDHAAAATLPPPPNLAPSARPAPPQAASNLTPTQRPLVRHVLGLISYCNRFVAAIGTPDHAEWLAMEEAGMASRRPWDSSTTDFFSLTPEGARAALADGERLDTEDFPR